eukprot:CAMPEP_0119326362 /NCGR_PEP_ID=MMETSP1333-20130426/68199_1 /TAXON_ID=418940 /ORGANISM="Scyphosphaera apsteinii, Strain RCC1455" /LENGTH=30 /DNA_ID= /DNA_START= /DNA_END= /DNA_ORIENTATION=
MVDIEAVRITLRVVMNKVTVLMVKRVATKV